MPLAVHQRGSKRLVVGQRDLLWAHNRSLSAKEPLIIGLFFGKSCMKRGHCAVLPTCFKGYCSTVQDLLDWFEVDLGFIELLFLQIDKCVSHFTFLDGYCSLSSYISFRKRAL